MELLARIRTHLELRRAQHVEHDSRATLKLLRRILPDHIIERLKAGQSKIADELESVTILFAVCNPQNTQP